MQIKKKKITGKLAAFILLTKEKQETASKLLKHLKREVGKGADTRRHSILRFSSNN